MFSWEIDKMLSEKHYIIGSVEYMKICDTSPQIMFIKYDSFADDFIIKTNDDYEWNFKLKKKER